MQLPRMPARRQLKQEVAQALQQVITEGWFLEIRIQMTTCKRFERVAKVLCGLLTKASTSRLTALILLLLWTKTTLPSRAIIQKTQDSGGKLATHSRTSKSQLCPNYSKFCPPNHRVKETQGFMGWAKDQIQLASIHRWRLRIIATIWILWNQLNQISNHLRAAYNPRWKPMLTTT